MKTTILHNQSILDVALQHTGDVQNSFEIAVSNGIPVSDVLTPGDPVEIPEDIVKNANILNEYKAKKIEPATGLLAEGNNELPPLKGIGYMQIGNNFKTS